ncbi:MAG: hypothetical protein DMG88_21850 [Acidobacteria bacterium]|nr:MAG: hypothetical protein DMG88_21850 [Acidobacteriota bacterium]
MLKRFGIFQSLLMCVASHVPVMTFPLQASGGVNDHEHSSGASSNMKSTKACHLRALYLPSRQKYRAIKHTSVQVERTAQLPSGTVCDSVINLQLQEQKVHQAPA